MLMSSVKARDDPISKLNSILDRFQVHFDANTPESSEHRQRVNTFRIAAAHGRELVEELRSLKHEEEVQEIVSKLLREFTSMSGVIYIAHSAWNEAKDRVKALVELRRSAGAPAAEQQNESQNEIGEQLRAA